MYKHFGTYSSTEVCTISIECIALVGWAKLISLSSRFVNHYCCTAWTVEWLTCCVQRRMFYKLYSAWVQNSSVIRLLNFTFIEIQLVCRSVHVSIFHFQFSLKMKIYVGCVFGLREQSYKKNCVKLLISIAKCLAPVFYPSRSVVKSSLESLTLCARTGFYSFY